MSFSEELEQFRSTHPYSETELDGVRVSYLLCGNENSRNALVYLVGGTGFSVVWFNHIKQMEREYRVLTFDYPYGVENLEELAELVIQVFLRRILQHDKQVTNSYHAVCINVFF